MPYLPAGSATYLGDPVWNENVESSFHKRRKKLYLFLLQSLPTCYGVCFFVALSGMRISVDLHRCLGSCTFQSGKTWSRAAGRNSPQTKPTFESLHSALWQEPWGERCLMVQSSQREEGYRKQEKNTLVRGQIALHVHEYLESRINESASRELIHSVLIHEVSSQAKAEGQSDQALRWVDTMGNLCGLAASSAVTLFCLPSYTSRSS